MIKRTESLIPMADLLKPKPPDNPTQRLFKPQ